MEKGNQLFHKLDRWIGIPIVFSLGLLKFKKKRITPLTISKLAILNIGSIGDNVLMSGIIADLRFKYPDIKITAFTGSTNYQIVKLIPGIDETIKLPITKFIATYHFIKAAGSFDLLIDFGPWPRLNSIYASFFKAGQTIGFNSKQQFRHYAYDIAVDHSDKLHEIDNFRNLIKTLYDGQPHLPKLSVIPSEKTVKLSGELGRYCIIHPWPGGYKSYMKEWPLNNWRELVAKISKHYEHIVITGAPSDNEKSAELFYLIKEELFDINLVNLSGQLNLQELTYLVWGSALIISVNTGVAHMAAALDVKQVCLHGPTNVQRWRPYSNNTISIVPGKGHFGYLNYGYEYHLAKENCMDNITPGQIYDAIALLSAF